MLFSCCFSTARGLCHDSDIDRNKTLQPSPCATATAEAAACTAAMTAKAAKAAGTASAGTAAAAAAQGLHSLSPPSFKQQGQAAHQDTTNTASPAVVTAALTPSLHLPLSTASGSSPASADNTLAPSVKVGKSGMAMQSYNAVKEDTEGGSGGSASVPVDSHDDAFVQLDRGIGGQGGRVAAAYDSDDDDLGWLQGQDKWEIQRGRQGAADGDRPLHVRAIVAGDAADHTGTTADGRPFLPEGCSPEGWESASGGMLCFRDGMVVSERMDRLLQKNRQHRQVQRAGTFNEPRARWAGVAHPHRAVCRPQPGVQGAQVRPQGMPSEMGSGGSQQPAEGAYYARRTQSRTPQKKHYQMGRGGGSPQQLSPLVTMPWAFWSHGTIHHSGLPMSSGLHFALGSSRHKVPSGEPEVAVAAAACVASTAAALVDHGTHPTLVV